MADTVIYYHPDEGSPELDLMVLEAVFNYEIRRVKPDWYDLEVHLAMNKETGLIEYSYDDNGCNAMMYMNGVDEKVGFAKPIPRYSLDDRGLVSGLLDIIQAMKERHGYDFCLATVPMLYRPYSYQASFYQEQETPDKSQHALNCNAVTANTVPLAVVIAALKVLKFPKNYWPSVFQTCG
jgi:hypothetical protein